MLGISAADIAMSTGKPRLLNVSPWLPPFCNGPKCRNKWATMFINSNRVKSYVDVIAEACVVEA
jgi:hypothetical protein